MQPSPTYQLLRSLIAIRSTYQNERELSAYLSHYLTAIGFSVDTVSSQGGRNNLVATYGSTSRYLAFYAHMDTVQPDHRYRQDPFTAWHEGNDSVRGLGSADMKGGITAILQLAEYAKNKKLPVKLIFGVDEENISIGAHDLVDAGVFSNVDFLISAESGQIENDQQPYSVCYGRRGRAAFKVSVLGKKAHAAESQKGINAIVQAAILVSNLSAISFPLSTRFGRTSMVVHEIHATTDSFSVPDECSFTLSTLTTPTVRHEDVCRKLRALAKLLGINAVVTMQPRTTPYSESYEVDRHNAFLRKIESSIFKHNAVKPLYTASVADENIFAHRLSIPVISLGPIGGHDHTADEWVSLSSIDRVAQCYSQILQLHENENSK